jgi:H+-transporting ATPase
MVNDAILPDPAKKATEGRTETIDITKTQHTGLTSAEAQKLLAQYGANEITAKKVSPIVKFLSYFWGPIPWMIEAAAILSALIQRWEDFIIISVLLGLNAVVGFWQEYKADNAIEMLKQKLALKARVKRDGQWTQVDAAELVPGDLVRVRLGDIVPADLTLTEGDYLSIDESALTGESLPVDKKIADPAYSGAVVKQGEMNGVVTATGLETFFGRTARLVAETFTKSHFQRAVIKIGDYLIVMALALVVLIFMVALFRHESWLDTLQFALILTVAAIPAALPAVLSVTMAVGASRLAEKKAIVSKLVAIEEIAGMDVLCSDKTGTITQNKLVVGDVKPFAGSSDADVLRAAALASLAENADAIDDAILKKAAEGWTGAATAGYEIEKFIPFDPVSKRTEAQVKHEGQSFHAAKGAPQAVLALLQDATPLEKEVEAIVNELAAKGSRALGVARTGPDGKWACLGIIGLYDPPREDSAATIDAANSMGVEVKMVTGDHEAIAREIAKRVHLKPDIRSAQELLDKPENEALAFVETANGFARVEILQKAGHIVGMTGDGVNDAPALKKADAGIAVAGATDAAKSAADIVLTEPGLSVIIDAVKESRKIFQRMNAYAIYRIAETIRVLFFITITIIVFNYYPVTAVMIVLLALFNDAPIMAIAYDNVHYSEQPEKWNMRVVLSMATFLGLIGVVSSFLIYYIGRDVFKLEPGVLQSFIFLKLAVAGHLTIFLARTRRYFWTIRPSSALFWSAVATKALATLVAVYGFQVAPIGWRLAGVVWIYALAAFVVTDVLKVQFYRILDHTDVRFKK